MREISSNYHPESVISASFWGTIRVLYIIMSFFGIHQEPITYSRMAVENHQKMEVLPSFNGKIICSSAIFHNFP